MKADHAVRSYQAATAARCFRQAATVIINAELVTTPRREPLMVIPFVVNATFACELYLKALAYRSNVALTGHSLLDLLAALPHGERQHLNQAWANLNKHGITRSAESMELVAREMSACFVDWRYSYEKEAVTAPQISAIFDLLNALDAAYWN